MPNQIRAALYVRVSSEEQARHGYSLAEQRARLLAYAKAHGLKVVGVYEDAGISARKSYRKRPALLRLLEDCKTGKIDTIYFIKLDRWFRNVADYYAVQPTLEKAGVTWCATEESYETQTAAGRLKVNIMLSVAQDEADRTSERIRFINDGRRANGIPIGTKAPLGLMIKNGAYTQTKDAPAVQAMFKYYIQTRSVNATKKYMLKQWGIDGVYNTFNRALRNRLYIGEVYGVPNRIPALIQKADFDLVQGMLAKQSQRCSGVEDSRIYLYSGLIYCRECGKTMQAETVKGTYTYYRCRTHNLDTTACPHTKRVRESELEIYLLEELEHIVKTAYSSAKKGRERKSRIAPAKILRKLDRLKELYLVEMIDMPTYRADYDKLQEQLHAAQAETPGPPDIASLHEAIAQYPKLSRIEKKEFWTRTIKRIDADNNGAFFVTTR